jgi:hypothetical protein
LVVAAYAVQRLLALNEDIALAATSGLQDLERSEMVCPNCSLCGGSGRLLGGLAALPWPFSLWPIKVYRPCPNFKGEYKRAGQTLDEFIGTRDLKRAIERDGKVVPLTRPKLNISLDDASPSTPPSPAPAAGGDSVASDPTATTPPRAKGFAPTPKKR